MSSVLRFSLIGWIALGLFGGMALGQATPAGFSYIPGGSFTMGRTSGDTDANAPSITVAVNPFYLQQTETTKALWDEVRTWAVVNGYTDLVAGAGKSADHPVQTVSWWEVLKWCNARSEKEGLTPVYAVGGNVMRTGTVDPEVNWSANGYRLPTEAEWEKAARGGVNGKRFPWGTDTISHADANFFNDGGEPYQSGTSGHHPTYATGGLPYTSPVRSFAANGYGLNDMAGNVWEWCWDWFGSDYYATSDGTLNPRGPEAGTTRVFRGGSWNVSVASLARCANRGAITPDKAFNNVGFRVARSSMDSLALPSVSDRTLTDVTTTGATLGANVTSDGGAAITERGIVFSATASNNNPLIGGSGVTKITAAGTTGVFAVPVTGLTPGTSYHFKAYVTNNVGTSYSSVASFVTISNNPNLTGLVLDGFSFTPSFSGATTSYTATVQRGDGSVKIRPSAAHSGASLFARVNGGGWVAVGSGSLSLPLTLEFGDNLLEVRVIAQDGSTEKTYSLEVFRNDPKPDAMVGQSLAFLGGTNVYESALAQQLKLISSKARAVSGYVMAANRGNVADRFVVQGSGGSRFFSVDYRDSGGASVTAAVRSGLYRTSEMDPGDSGDWLLVNVKPVKKLLVVKKRKKIVTLRKVHTLLIQASSVLDPSVGDGVSIRVETR